MQNVTYTVVAFRPFPFLWLFKATLLTCGSFMKEWTTIHWKTVHLPSFKAWELNHRQVYMTYGKPSFLLNPLFYQYSLSLMQQVLIFTVLTISLCVHIHNLWFFVIHFIGFALFFKIGNSDCEKDVSIQAMVIKLYAKKKIVFAMIWLHKQPINLYNFQSLSSAFSFNSQLLSPMIFVLLFILLDLQPIPNSSIPSRFSKCN